MSLLERTSATRIIRYFTVRHRLPDTIAVLKFHSDCADRLTNACGVIPANCHYVNTQPDSEVIFSFPMPAVLAAMMQGKKMQTFCSTYSQIVNLALAIAFLKHIDSILLPRDATIARYMLSLCVCPSVCLSVGLSVCPSQAGTVPKRLKVGSRKQRHTIAQVLQFSVAKNFSKFQRGHPKQRWGRFKLAIFDQHLAISQKGFKWGLGYYGTQIETSMRLIEWRYSSELELPPSCLNYPKLPHFRYFVLPFVLHWNSHISVIGQIGLPNPFKRNSTTG